MARIPWYFHDPVLDETYAWPVNPSEDNGSNTISKASKFQVQAGMHRNSAGIDDISTIMMQGGKDLESFSYSGNIYNQQQLEAFEYWCEKDYAVELTDDLGRTWSVLIESFSTQRVRSNQNPYKHSYQMTGIILEELGD